MSIKRPVTRADVDGQLSLFGDDSNSQLRLQTSSPSSRVFIEPDPARMQIGLKEHLQKCGAGNVFIIDQLLKEQDWSIFESAYATTGRAPYAPRAMVALILFGVMQGKSSLRDLESLSRDSLSCLWLTGGIMPEHSIIGRFIHRHASVLCGEFFEDLTRSVLKHTHSDVKNTAGDGTVIEAAASRYETIRREALEKRIAKEQQRMDDKDDPPDDDKKRTKVRLEKLKEAERRLSEREEQRRKKGKNPKGIQINPQDPDAVNQKLKRQGYGVCFKPGALANSLRVIVGYGVDATSEPRVALESLAQADRIGTMQESSWDAGYSNYDMLLKQKIYDIEMLIPEGQNNGVSRKNSSKRYPKSEFTYDAESDTYRCPAGSILIKKETYKATATKQAYTRYGTSDCKHCQQRENCTTSKTGRRIERSMHEPLREQMRKKMQNESVQARYRKRSGMVEPVFSNLQQQQGLTRFRRKGLAAVRLEFALHVLAHNVSRAVANWSTPLCLLVLSAIDWLHKRIKLNNTATRWEKQPFSLQAPTAPAFHV